MRWLGASFSEKPRGTQPLDTTKPMRTLIKLEQEITQLQPQTSLAKDALDYAKANIEQAAEWFRTAEKRENEL